MDGGWFAFGRGPHAEDSLHSRSWGAGGWCRSEAEPAISAEVRLNSNSRGADGDWFRTHPCAEDTLDTRRMGTGWIVGAEEDRTGQQ